MKIKSLDGLRVVVALCIYTFHAHLMLRNFFSVSFFFMLSGFVLYYSESDRSIDFSIINNIKWSFKHIIRLYPLHILMFLFSIFIRYEWVESLSTQDLLIKGFLNITLLQSLCLNPYTFNFCSWYISTLCIIYFFALPIINYIKKSSYETEMLLAIIIIFQYIVNYYFLKYEPHLSFIYSHPIYRITDVVLGILTAKLFLKYRKKNINVELINISQLFIVVIFTIMLIASFNFRETTNYFSVLFVFLIFIQAFDKGWLSGLLNNRYVQGVAKITFEFYMCHELILFLLEKNITPYLSINNQTLKCLIVWFVGLPISLICAKVLNITFTKKIRGKFYSS